MTKVIPFNGILYNMSKVKGDDVTAPPYDIITPEEKKEFYSKSPYNIVKIDFGEELSSDNDSDNKYTRAAGFLKTWLDEKILIQDKKPSFYVYEVECTVKNRQKKLRGFFGLIELQELGKGSVYPHEHTHSKAKVDRLLLMRACNANTSPIFSLYNSPEKTASKIINKTIDQAKPYIEARDSKGSMHRLWVIDDKADTGAITKELKDKAIFIADGHHRYETAIEFQKEMKAKGDSSGTEPYNYTLMLFTNIADGDLTVLPTHRLVKEIPADSLKRLESYFNIEKLSPDKNIEEAISGQKSVIGFYKNGNHEQYLLRYKGGGLDDVHPALKGLDVTVLHELILKKILNVNAMGYEKDAEKVKDMIRKGLCGAAFFLNPTDVHDVENVALASLRMPPKSTYFYPKIINGFVFNKFSIT
jgi:uncharacterized protein (DUF1015 family)